MQNLKRNDEGFTLLETLVVLFAVSVIVVFPTIKLEQTIETVQIDLFFRELTTKVTEMQTHAIIHGESTKIEFKPPYNTIIFSINEKETKSRIIEDEWVIDNEYYSLGGTTIRDFIFKGGSGNITKSNRIIFNTTKGKFELIYQMGSGRIDIRKAE